MTKTSMESDLFHSFEIISQLGVEIVRDHLAEVSIFGVSLSVQEPFRDVVVGRSSDNVINLFQIGFCQLSSSIKQNFNYCSNNRNLGLVTEIGRSTVIACFGPGLNLPLVEINLGDLENDVSESATNTFDSSNGKSNLMLSLDVGVLNTQDVGEFVSLSKYD